MEKTDFTKAQAIIDEAFPASNSRFMEAVVTERIQWAELDGRPGVTWVELEYFDGPHDNTGEHFTEDGDYEPGEYSFAIIEGYGARMSAPGYTDCTAWFIFDTPEEAAEYLAERYGEEPEEDERNEALEEQVKSLLADIQEIEGEVLPEVNENAASGYIFDFAGYLAYVPADKYKQAQEILGFSTLGAKVYNGFWQEERSFEQVCEESPYEVIWIGRDEMVAGQRKRITAINEQIETLEEYDADRL